MKEETKKFDEIVSRLLEKIESLEERLALRNARLPGDRRDQSVLYNQKAYRRWNISR